VAVVLDGRDRNSCSAAERAPQSVLPHACSAIQVLQIRPEQPSLRHAVAIAKP
jgi:hypothetical protein